MRALHALVLVVLLAGCAAPAQTSDTGPSYPLRLEKGNEPRPDMSGTGFYVLWNFTAEWRPAVDSGSLNLTLDVDMRGRETAGSDTRHESFRKGEWRFVEMRTPFLGIGHYAYTLDAHDEQGKLVGRLVGNFETCRC